MTKNPNTKKRISVNLAKAIEPLVKDYYKYLKISNDEVFKLYLTDKDESSDLFFGIKNEYKDSQAKHRIAYYCKPFSSMVNETDSGDLQIVNFINSFKVWLENIKYYETDSILDDPILQGYQNEYYSDFKIMDADADVVSFNYKQQLMLTEFLENVYNGIDSLKNEKNENVIKEIKNDLKDLQGSVTTETKNGFMKKLSKIFAKTRKGGIKISNYVLSEFIKGFIKEGGKHAFNFAVNNADKLPDYIEQIGQFITQIKG